MAEAKTFFLKLTAAVALDGLLARAGTVIEVNEPVAKNLLHRGKARVATVAECEAAGFTSDAGSEDTAPQAPTREDLDAALAQLPGDYTDADYVVNGMRGHFGELFTDDDEATVRELVKAPAGKPSDGLTVAQLREALKAKGVHIPAECNTKAELSALLDGQPAA